MNPLAQELLVRMSLHAKLHKHIDAVHAPSFEDLRKKLLDIRFIEKE
jgi:hypothetical protein